MSFTKAVGISIGADKTHCPLCGHYQYPEHKSGTGCKWCDHTNSCPDCAKADADKAKGKR